MTDKNIGKKEYLNLIKVLKSIDSKLTHIMTSVSRFEEFVLEVSPSEAKDEINELIDELDDANLDGI